LARHPDLDLHRIAAVPRPHQPAEIDAGLDVQATYPPRPAGPGPMGAAWTYDAFLAAGEACRKAGVPFGLGLGNTADSVGNATVWAAAYGAELVDAKGNIVVDSEHRRTFLDRAQKLVRIQPADALSYDDATDNRVMIARQSALIYDPPSPYAVAKRDGMKVHEDIWSFPCPAGPAGRFIPHGHAFCGIWSFSRNKTAAKELNVYLSQRPLFEERCRTVEGFDLAVLTSMSDSTVWDEIAPPKGVFSNYPIRLWHGSQPLIAGHRRADRQPRHHAEHAGQAVLRPVGPSGDRLGQGRGGRLRPAVS
jgi:hypothetical protein